MLSEHLQRLAADGCDLYQENYHDVWNTTQMPLPHVLSTMHRLIERNLTHLSGLLGFAVSKTPT